MAIVKFPARVGQSPILEDSQVVFKVSSGDSDIISWGGEKSNDIIEITENAIIGGPPDVQWDPRGEVVLYRAPSELSEGDCSCYCYDTIRRQSNLVVERIPCTAHLIWSGTGNSFGVIVKDSINEYSRDGKFIKTIKNPSSVSFAELLGVSFSISKAGIPEGFSRNLTLGGVEFGRASFSPKRDCVVFASRGDLYTVSGEEARNLGIDPFGSDKERKKLEDVARRVYDSDSFYWPDLGFWGVDGVIWTPDEKSVAFTERQEVKILDLCTLRVHRVSERGRLLAVGCYVN